VSARKRGRGRGRRRWRRRRRGRGRRWPAKQPCGGRRRWSGDERRPRTRSHFSEFLRLRIFSLATDGAQRSPSRGFRIFGAAQEEATLKIYFVTRRVATLVVHTRGVTEKVLHARKFPPPPPPLDADQRHSRAKKKKY
jgi:hypothetical protein